MNGNDISLKNEIIKLVNLKHEGSYWDFKKSWYEENHKSDLLHDIICMANNLESRDSYIIIGIDEEHDFAIQDISVDPNRKATQNLVDFLKDKSFSGNVRPSVHVETIHYSLDKIVDVIVIENSYYVPFYLTKSYKDVFANQIYTRVQDTNTPKNSSADINHIEHLWKKRFHLTDSPFERFKYYLKDKENWIYSPTEQRRYYKYHPEFIIVYEDDDQKGFVYYLFAQEDYEPHWESIKLMYFSTELQSFQGISLDGGRYFTLAPLFGYITLLNSKTIHFRYLIKDTTEFEIHNFYYDHGELNGDEIPAYNKFINSILIFENEKEFDYFKYYAEQNWNSFNIHSEHRIPTIPEIKDRNMSCFATDWKNFFKLKEMLEFCRNNNLLY